MFDSICLTVPVLEKLFLQLLEEFTSLATVNCLEQCTTLICAIVWTRLSQKLLNGFENIFAFDNLIFRGSLEVI